MQPSLFVEHQPTGTAFYIDGELQFHSADERIYHEYLVIPALGLAQQRFQGQGLRVLICGGGDGLAVREVLRFPDVKHIDLVDYDPAVVELARTEFAAFNENSLENERVQVHIHEAFAFLRQQVAESVIEPGAEPISNNQNTCYHLIVCDFTYPLRQEYTDIYAKEWFSLLQSRLVSAGLLAVNGFSPNHNTMAFWCLYQTIRAAGFHCLPMWLNVPSFTSHDYGYWGFMLASTGVITREDLAILEFPQDLRALTLTGLYQAFCIPANLVNYLNVARVHHQGSSQLFFYLLNRKALSITRNMSNSLTEITEIIVEETITELEQSQSRLIDLVDFLEYTPIEFPQEPDQDPLAMETLAQEWLRLSQQYLDEKCLNEQYDEKYDEKYLDSQPVEPDASSWKALPLPVQHFYHTPEMMHLWRGRLQYLLNYLDWRQLVEKLKAKNTELPADDVAKLERIYANMSGVPSDHGSQTQFPSVQLSKITLSELTTATRAITLVGLTLLLANTVAPDAAFAKGGFFGISTGSSGSGGDGGLFSWGLTGLFLTVGGITWLNALGEAERKEREAQNQAPPVDDEEA